MRKWFIMKKKNIITLIKDYVTVLEGNARVCIAFHPMWAIPYSFYFFYLSLYMKEHGVTDSQLGFLMLSGSVVSIVFSFIAAPIVDHMGRKRATLVFDLISSALPPLIYAISGSFWFSLIAVILTNANRIMSIAYYLVMVEDANDEQRIIAFNLFNIITIAAGIFIPVAGFLVNRYGLVRTEKFFLVFSFISMTTLIILRNIFLKETETGKEILKKNREQRFSFNKIAKPYIDSGKYLRKKPVTFLTVIANIIFYIYYMIGTNNSLYFAPYLADVLNLNEFNVSVIGSVYAAGMLFAMLVINPLIQKFNIFLNLIIGTILNIIGLFLLVLIPGGSLSLAVISTLVTSLGFGILKSLIDAALAITTEGESRSGIYSIANLFSGILGSITSGLIGILYPLNPRSVYITSILLLFISLFCFVFIIIRFAEERQTSKAI